MLLIICRNQKDLLLSPVYKYFCLSMYKVCLLIGHPIEENHQHISCFLSKQLSLKRKNEEICCITSKGKTAESEWENDD